MDERKATRWLKLTQQQFDIVKIVYRLDNRGVKTSPKNIQREYRREYDKHLMKPNLFNILRLLKEKRIVAKTGQAKYTVDEEGIKKCFEDAKVELEGDMLSLDKTCDQVDSFFKQITYVKEQPEIQYLEGVEFHRAMADTVEKSRIFHVVANFPVIAYSREMTHALEREIYAEALWHSCLRDKKVHVNYLTDLDIDYLFNHAFRTYGDPKTAYRECHTIVDRLLTQVETHKELDVRYMSDPHGLDVAISEHREPTEFIIFTRDEHGDLQGGIRIKSRKTASNALTTYNRSFKYATPLNTQQGKKQIQKIKETLAKKYGILGE